jgi:hypothetical protein
VICEKVCDVEETLVAESPEEIEQSNSDGELNFDGFAGELEEKLAQEESDSCDDDDRMPDLLPRVANESSSDEDDDNDSIPDLMPHTFGGDDLSEDTEQIIVDWQLLWQESIPLSIEGDGEVFLNEQVNFSDMNLHTLHSGRKNVIKWLLDTGSASINAETNGDVILNKKPCSSTINIADGKSITPRGIGTKTLLDYKTGYPLQIKKMHHFTQ